MLDINFIRQNPDKVKQGCQKKNVDVDIDRLLELDRKKRELLKEIEDLRHQKNLISGSERGQTSDPLEPVERAKELKEKIKSLEEQFKLIDKEFARLLFQVPIPPASDVPEGKTEEENVPIKFWGKPPKFKFQPKNYITLMKSLNLLDLERGAKVGGFRQYVLRNEAVLLEQALLRRSLDFLAKKGFSLFRPSILVKEFALIGTGMFPSGREDTYKVDENLFLAGTTEVPLMAFHAGEILKEEELPKKYAGISVAFRKEVGSYGKDVKGIFRVHEFWQTEQVVICKADEKESIKWHEELLKISEEIMQELKLPYRVVNVCGGELGSGQVKRYDIEAWVPSQGRYRETHSDSYLFDFQCRRLNIKYKTKQGETKFCHSLNNTGIAVPRILIPILENYQRKDGKIEVPKVLQKYLPRHQKVIPFLSQ
ncbi:MAG: serine--tRNA ligase [Patescibacteria group bacterium]|nr:serine--tRNA ligase [Patescibacteria group bacterium]